MSKTITQESTVDWYKTADLIMKFIALLSVFVVSASIDVPERLFERASSRKPIVSIEGQVLQNSIAYMNGEPIEITPIFVHIWNDGKTTFEIESIRQRVFEANFANGSDSDKGTANPTLTFAKGEPSENRRIVVIDNAGEGWIEISDAKTSRVPESCTLHPKQRVQETFHVATAGTTELLKFEINVRTQIGQSFQWRGFSNPALCRPIPSAPSSGNTQE